MQFNGKILQKLRYEKGITQQVLCRDLQLEQPVYSRYERGAIKNPPATKVKQFAEYFDVPYESFFNETEEKPEKKAKNYSGISKLLKKQGKTQTWLSEKTGIPRANINRYATGSIKYPNANTLEIIAKALDVDVDDMAEFNLDQEQNLGAQRIDVHVHIKIDWGF
jgi:transcriptional regulator with XRE-family HTH domain